MVSFEPLFRELAKRDIKLYKVFPGGIFSLTKIHQVEKVCSRLGCKLEDVMEIIPDGEIPPYVRYIKNKVSFSPLFDYLDKHKYSMREVSIGMKKADTYLSHMKNKIAKPPYSDFVRLALSLRVDPASLFEVEND